MKEEHAETIYNEFKKVWEEPDRMSDFSFDSDKGDEWNFDFRLNND